MIDKNTAVNKNAARWIYAMVIRMRGKFGPKATVDLP